MEQEEEKKNKNTRSNKDTRFWVITGCLQLGTADTITAIIPEVYFYTFH